MAFLGIDAGINFVESRVKDGNSAYVGPDWEDTPLGSVAEKPTTYLWQERMTVDVNGRARIHYEQAA